MGIKTHDLSLKFEPKICSPLQHATICCLPLLATTVTWEKIALFRFFFRKQAVGQTDEALFPSSRVSDGLEEEMSLAGRRQEKAGQQNFPVRPSVRPRTKGRDDGRVCMEGGRDGAAFSAGEFCIFLGRLPLHFTLFAYAIKSCTVRRSIRAGPLMG